MTELTWGILLAAYLFVGGLAGGSYVIAAVADLFGKGKYKVLSKSGTYVSLLSIIIGLVLLIVDLGRFDVDPLSPLNAYINFPTSIMSFGTWIITAFMVVSLVTSVLWFFRGNSIIRKIVEIAGIVLGGSTAAYTGLLLSFSRGILFWASPFLPWLFIISGLLTGLVMAWIMVPLISWFAPRFFEDFKDLFDVKTHFARLVSQSQRYTVVLTILELLILIVFVASVPNSSVLTAGRGVGMFFYAYLILGIIIPLAMEYYQGRLNPNVNEIRVLSTSMISFVLILVGGFLLRYVILTAGQISI
jgi:polysulfide reductase chain C